jgi:hypothetical protein
VTGASIGNSVESFNLAIYGFLATFIVPAYPLVLPLNSARSALLTAATRAIAVTTSA